MSSEKMRVLVIDPDGWHGCMLSAMYQGSGHAVETCRCFQKGGQLAEASFYDCIVLVAFGRDDDCLWFHAMIRRSSPSTKIVFLTRLRDDALRLPRDDMTFSSVSGF